MKKAIGLLLLIIAGYNSTMAQWKEYKNKAECATEFEAYMKKNYRGYYGSVANSDRRKYFDPHDGRIWVLPEQGDTIFCDKAEFLAGGPEGTMPTAFFKNKKKVFEVNSTTEGGRFVNMKACSFRENIYEAFGLPPEMITKHKLSSAYSKVKKILFRYVSENKKVKVLSGYTALGTKNYHIDVAVDKQTGEIIDFIEGTNTSSSEAWEGKQKVFYNKHLAVDCEEYKYAYKAYLPYKNVFRDEFEIRFLLWLNAQRKCEGMSNNFELVDCYYKDIYDVK